MNQKHNMATETGVFPFPLTKVQVSSSDPTVHSAWCIEAEEVSFINDNKVGVVTLSIRVINKNAAQRPANNINNSFESTSSNSRTVLQAPACEQPSARTRNELHQKFSPQLVEDNVNFFTEHVSADPAQFALQPYPAESNTDLVVKSPQENQAQYAKNHAIVLRKPNQNLNLRPRLPSASCNVAGCGIYTRSTVVKDDALGPAGPRCKKHGGESRWSVCNVAGCQKFKVGVVYASDALGEAGPRCMKHGAAFPRCNVATCDTYMKGYVTEPDHLGSEGPRCIRHGAMMPRCNVMDCTSKKKGIVHEFDELGAPGPRCIMHGARRPGFKA